MLIAPNPRRHTPVNHEAYATLDRVQVRGTDRDLLAIRLGLPSGSFLADVLDDFLPGAQSQYLDAILQPTPDGGWQLGTHVDTMDAASQRFFTATGDFSHWG